MLQDLNMRPWTFLRHARNLAELHVKINGLSIEDLPSYKDGLGHSIRRAPHLSDALRHKALALLDALPDGRTVCHGDYHPGNVILTKQGPVAVDWMTVKAGSQWADVSRTCLLLNIGARSAGRQVKPAVRILISMFHRAYLGRYMTLNPDSQKELDRWRAVTAAARLNENITPERDALIKMVEEG